MHSLQFAIPNGIRQAMRFSAIATLSILCVTVFASQQIPHTSPVPYFIDDGKATLGFQPSDKELARWALDAWSRESGNKLKFEQAPNKDAALIQLHWVSANEGLFGETQRVLVHGQPGAAVLVMPAVSQLGEPLATRALADPLLRDTIVYLTCVHELGHAIGLDHTRNFDDIMYSFAYGGDIVQYFLRYRTKLKTRADIVKYSGLSAGDIRTLQRLYP